ncbi:MAG TPA: response regulator, partial [Vicinamibacterales bacterium]|nr:response regulator [Vicinamibacterales bacterium]
MQQEPLVMLVEDDEGTRDGYAEFLERGGFRVAQAASAEDALSQCGTQVPDVVVTDIALPGRDGFALAAELKHQLPTRGV